MVADVRMSGAWAWILVSLGIAVVVIGGLLL
jgi:hypothetical protein